MVNYNLVPLDISPITNALALNAKRQQEELERQRAIGASLNMFDTMAGGSGMAGQLGALGKVYGGSAANTPAFAGGRASMKMPADPAIEEKFIGELKAGGLTNPFGLAAMAAYANAESGYSPRNITGAWSDPSESGAPGMSGGILSWRGDRLANMRRMTGGMDPVTGQAKFALTENPELTMALQNAKSPEEANQLMANAWRFAGYNRPGGEFDRRLNMTRQYASRFGGAGETAAPVEQGRVLGTNSRGETIRLNVLPPREGVQVASAGNVPIPAVEPTTGQERLAAMTGTTPPSQAQAAPVQVAQAELPPPRTYSVGDFISPQQQQALRNAAASPDPRVRQQALEYIGNVQQAVQSANIKAAQDYQSRQYEAAKLAEQRNYEQQKEANKPVDWQRFETADGRQMAFNPRTLQTSILDAGGGGWRPATPEELGRYGRPENASMVISPKGEPKVLAGGTPKPESAYDVGMAKHYQEQHSGLLEAEGTANQTKNALRLMRGLVNDDNFYSGTGGNLVKRANSAMVAMGMKDPGAASAAEAFQAFANEVTLGKLGGKLGAGVSNTDVGFIQQIAPQLANTRAGNKLIIDFTERMMDRRLEVAKMAREYAKKNNGRLDAGWDEMLADFQAKNPLFSEADVAKATEAASEKKGRTFFQSLFGRSPTEATPPAAQGVPGVTIRRLD